MEGWVLHHTSRVQLSCIYPVWVPSTGPKFKKWKINKTIRGEKPEHKSNPSSLSHWRTCPHALALPFYWGAKKQTLQQRQQCFHQNGRNAVPLEVAPEVTGHTGLCCCQSKVTVQQLVQAFLLSGLLLPLSQIQFTDLMPYYLVTSVFVVKCEINLIIYGKISLNLPRNPIYIAKEAGSEVPPHPELFSDAGLQSLPQICTNTKVPLGSSVRQKQSRLSTF